MAKGAIQFRDINKFNAQHVYYMAPNEEPLVIRDIIKYKRINRAAGICSAGEVGLIGMLPSVRTELILIDHSYKSLSIAMQKYLLLYEYGWEESIRILSGQAGSDSQAIIAKLAKTLPAAVKETLVPLGYQYPPFRIDPSIARMWAAFPPTLIKRVCEKLDLVKFIHGDLNDLKKEGLFDLLYVSNAVGHSNRKGRYPTMAEFTKLVKPGGLIIGAVSKHAPDEEANVINEVIGGPSQWKYRLYQTAA